MVMRCPPFRKANLKDPFYKRLCNNDKKSFWNIFKNIFATSEFKDLFEKTSQKDPEERLCMKEILAHKWMDGEKHNEVELREEIIKRYEVIEKTCCMDFS